MLRRDPHGPQRGGSVCVGKVLQSIGRGAVVPDKEQAGELWGLQCSDLKLFQTKYRQSKNL